MNFSRITKSAAVLALAALGLTACGSGGGIDSGAQKGASAGTTTITFAAAMFAESGRGPKLQALLNDFNASQSEVKVEPASIPFASFAPTIFTQMGGGVGPDLIRFDISDFYSGVQAGLLEPLDQYVDAKDYKFLAPDKYNLVDGKRYGVTFEISNYALLYNPTLVPTPPSSFDEFLTAAKAATKDGAYGFGYRTTMPEQAGMWQDLSNFVYGFGGRWSDGGKLTLNSSDVVEGITKFRDVYAAEVTPKGADASTYRRMFGDSKLAMEIDNGGVPAILYGQTPSLPLDAVKSPFPEDTVGQILTPLVMNASSKNKEASAKFVKWLLEPANQAKLQLVLGAGNPATEVERTAEELKAMPFVKTYDSLTAKGRPFVVEGFETKTPDIRKIVVEQAIKVLQNGEDPKAAMDAAQKAAEAQVGR
jgi:multiple sugar transport system substrate-binding protein